MRFLLLLLLLPNLAFAAASAPFISPRDSVRLISAANTAPGGQIRLGLEFSLRPGWHIYWRDPGDAGFPPSLRAVAPVTLGPIDWPAPDYFLQAGVAAYVLSGHVLLPFTARGVGGSVSLSARWLVCADQCVPEHASFTLALPGGAAAEAALFPAGPGSLPSPFPARLAPDGTLRLSGPTATQVRAARFFPDAPDALVNSAAQPLSFTPDGLQLGLRLAGPAPDPLTGLLVLTDPSGQRQALQISAPPGPPEAAHAPWWLLALLGGLLLNLMPCVFPVLAMKAVSLCRLGGAAHAQVRREALGYGAGVMASMAALGALLLALRAAGGVPFWGFQFQHPAFVALAGWVMLAAGLNLAGLFAVRAPGWLGRIPARHSFFTGLLAVVLATPCTAPFMATALAAAFALPALPAMGLFLALGAGLALPVLVLAAVPALAAALPRPGGWMLGLQKLLAIPMLGSFAWLAWVLFRQTGPDGLLLLLLGAVALALALPRRPSWGLAVLLLLPLLRPAPAAPLTLPGAAPYSPQKLAALRAAGQPVFIDLTAAWCVTCLVNERGTLATPRIQDLFHSRHVAVLVGDWTSRDPAITALLAQNHRAGVPLYLYYPPGGAAQSLPAVLTPGLLTRAIQG